MAFGLKFPQRKMTGLRQKNLVRSSPVLLQEIPLTAASAFFLWTITRIAMVLSWMEMQRPCMIFWCRIMWWITASIWTVLIFFFEFPDTITFEAVVEDGSFQRKGESYVQATNDVKTAIQAASDAFFPMIIHRHSGSGGQQLWIPGQLCSGWILFYRIQGNL